MESRPKYWHGVFLIFMLLVILFFPNMSFSAPNHPMTFRDQASGGNCDECEWILAEGVIGEGTPDLFDTYWNGNRRRSIRFNSDGGNVLAALKLGRLIRSRGLNTFVGAVRVWRDEDRTGDTAPAGKDNPLQHSACYSACVYAFLGGVNRAVDAVEVDRGSEGDGKIGIHQFYGPGAIANPEGKNLTALDAAGLQKLSASLTSYAREMGVDPQLVEMASQITPWEPIKILTGRELADFHVVTTSPPRAKWSIEVIRSDAIATVDENINGTDSLTISIYCASDNRRPTLYVATHRNNFHWNKQSEISLNDRYELGKDTFIIDNRNVSDVAGRFSKITVEDKTTASFKLILARREVAAILAGRTLKISAWEPKFNGFDLGGKVSLQGAAAIIPYVLKNCVYWHWEHQERSKECV
jgi:hypothetical protein